MPTNVLVLAFISIGFAFAVLLPSVYGIIPAPCAPDCSYFCQNDNCTSGHNLTDWDTSGVTSMAYMFQGAAFFNQPISDWNVSAVTDMSHMFSGASSFNQPIGSWNVNSVTSLAGTFFNTLSFNQTIGSWDVSNVGSMFQMFESASAFNSSIRQWNVSSVTNMTLMFSGATSFLDDLTCWCVKNVAENYFFAPNLPAPNLPLWGQCPNCTAAVVPPESAQAPTELLPAPCAPDCSHYFQNGANNLAGTDVTVWDTSSVTSMVGMFSGASSFNQPIGIWNVGSVTDMSEMFLNASLFDQPIGNWDVRNVKKMAATFAFASSFTQDIGGWNVSSVTNTDSMFLYATSFNRSIASWNVSRVTTMASMFDGAASFLHDLSCWCVTGISSPAAYSKFAPNLPSMYSPQWGLCPVCGLQPVTMPSPPPLAPGMIRAPCAPSCAFYFQNGANNLDTANLTSWDVSGVTNMNSMFQGATSFNQDISNWDVSQVTNMENMFFGANSFNQPIGRWDTRNVRNMRGMFSQTSAFNQDISGWSVNQVTDMSNMFGTSIFNQPIGNWDVSNVRYTAGMFINSPFNAPIGNWSVRNVVDMGFMFYGAHAFNQPIGAWNTESVTAMPFMFSDAVSFNQDISSWNVTGVRDMVQTFNRATAFSRDLSCWCVPNSPSNEQFAPDLPLYYQPQWGQCPNCTGRASVVPAPCAPDCSFYFQYGGNNLSRTDLSRWDTSNVRNMNGMFQDATLFNQPIGNWNVSGVTNMNSMFRNASVFNQPISLWDVSQVENMDSMFNSAGSFNQPIGSWNVSKVTTMAAMFLGASSFNQSLSQWNVGSVTSMRFMFGSASPFWDDLSCWCVQGITGGEPSFEGFAPNIPMSFHPLWGQCPVCGTQPTESPTQVPVAPAAAPTGLIPAPCAPNCAFYFQNGANNLAATNLTLWDVSGVTNMNSMFHGASSFNQDVSGWDVGQVTDMSNMFRGASSFNQPIGKWNVSNVKTMFAMFFGATAFNQSIGDWDVSQVTSVEQMFSQASSFNQPLDRWNVSNVVLASSMFQSALVFNRPIGSWSFSKVEKMALMFYGASSFNQPIGNWDVSSVIDMSYSFFAATSFNQPLSRWNVSNVVDMRYMFYFARSFNHPIERWNVSRVTAMESMFAAALTFNQNLTCWCVSNVRTYQNFADSTPMTQQRLPRWGQCPVCPVEPEPAPVAPPRQIPVAPPVAVCVRRSCDGLCGYVQDGCGGFAQCSPCALMPPPMNPPVPGTVTRIRYPVVPVFNCWEPVNSGTTFYRVRFGYINFDNATQTRVGRENLFEPSGAILTPSSYTVFASGTYAMILEAVVNNVNHRLVNWTLDSSVVWSFNTSSVTRCPTRQTANLVITTAQVLNDEQKLNITKAIAAKVGVNIRNLIVQFYNVAKKRELTYNVAITFLTPGADAPAADPGPSVAPAGDVLSEVTASSAASLLALLTVDEISTILTDSVEGVSIEVQQAPVVEPPPSSVVATIPPPEIITVPGDEPPVSPPAGAVTEPISAVNPLIPIIAGAVAGGIVLIILVVVVVKLRDRIYTRIAINAWFNRKKRIRPQPKPQGDQIVTEKYRTSLDESSFDEEEVEMRRFPPMEPVYVASLGASITQPQPNSERICQPKALNNIQHMNVTRLGSDSRRHQPKVSVSSDSESSSVESI